MTQSYTETHEFVASRQQLDQIIEKLQSKDMSNSQHGELERFINKQGTELMRLLMQDHLDLRALCEPVRESIQGGDGVIRTRKRRDCKRPLMSLFGQVIVTRIGYSAKNASSLFPLDAALNLPVDKYSHGLQQRGMAEAQAKSFDESVSTLKETTGGEIPKIKMEQLTSSVTCDFEQFYESTRQKSLEKTDDILAMSIDGKGVVMKHDSLREGTQRAAKKQKHKMKTRLSRGEKANRKRMATVASVYDIGRHIRTAEAIMAVDEKLPAPARPRPGNKRVWASLERKPEDVTEEMFQEALQRDPEKLREWVVLVDGQASQLKNVWSCIFRHGAEGTTVILDFIHVLEYLWKAAYSFVPEGSEEAEKWVQERALSILNGNASHVAAGIRRAATKRNLEGKDRESADKCANYLLQHVDMMRFPTYLAKGYPIATGVIEGACRHLIKDRMDITGARWGLDSAEGVLKLRSLKSSGDLDAYMQYHWIRELERNHLSKFAMPLAA